jgi:acyl-CoA thioester hydrolase
MKPRFGELDPYNHLNHSVYVVWFEVGRCEALEAMGIGLPELSQRGFQFVVSTLNVRYLTSAVAGEILELETELSELGGATTIWQQRLRHTSGDLLCAAELRAAFCATTGRPTRIPPDIRAQLEPLVVAGHSPD